MAKRIRIVIPYAYDESWIGGTYYVQNLILALNQVEDSKKPLLLVATNNQKEFETLVSITGYPYIESVTLNKKQNLPVRIINKICRTIFKQNLFHSPDFKYDLFFQTLQIIRSGNNKKVLYWIPDFQEHYYPAFFNENELFVRKNFQATLVKKGKFIVFSSENAKLDFNTFYPENTLKQFVLPFASILPVFDKKLSITDLLLKYKLPPAYFICCNQFWIHKNHKVVLNAIHELKKDNIPVAIAFTGKEFDHRSPDYFNAIKKLSIDLGIENQVYFLGFINRTDQLMLMKYAQAVIQPSLFEGWSTVIEDAKALNSNVIASNIAVHQEQLNTYQQKIFFDPNNEKELAICLNEKIKAQLFNYDELVAGFGNKLIAIAKEITN